MQGSGTQQDPYVITNVQELQSMNDNLSAHYVLGNNIDASDTVNWNNGEGFRPIGTVFTGSLDGRGFTIEHLSINRTASSRAVCGLFNVINNVTIKNIILRDFYIYSGDGNIGALAYQVRGESTIENCLVDGATLQTAAPYVVGGLIGESYLNSLLRINNCHVQCDISLAPGYNGDIGSRVGGLVGLWQELQGGLIDVVLMDNCGVCISVVTTGVPNGIFVNMGGLVGCFDYSENTTWIARNCYSVVDYDSVFSSYYYTQGLIGRNNSQFGKYSLQSCHTGNVLDSKMKQQSTYVDWDFENTWYIDEGNSYPELRVFMEDPKNSLPYEYSSDTINKSVKEYYLSIDTSRTISSRQNVIGDLLRTVFVSSSHEPDTMREVVSLCSLEGKFTRRVLQDYLFSVDSKRKLTKIYVRNGSSRRDVVKKYNFESDLCRILHQDCVIILDTYQPIVAGYDVFADVISEIVKDFNHPTDTTRSILLKYDSEANSKRDVTKEFFLNTDTFRKILLLSQDVHTVDILRLIMSSYAFDTDTFRAVMHEGLWQADTALVSVELGVYISNTQKVIQKEIVCTAYALREIVREYQIIADLLKKATFDEPYIKLFITLSIIEPNVNISIQEHKPTFETQKQNVKLEVE